MQLDPAQLDRYREDGFLVVPSLFDPAEVDVLQAAFHADCAGPGPHRILEDDGDVRSLYASHQRRAEFAALVRSARLLAPVRQLLAADVYVYQFKINAKPAFGGDRWVWHQDFPAWRLADNLPSPRLVNVGFFLDEVTEFNGPLIFIPGSHRAGSVRRLREGRAVGTAEHLDPDEIAVGPDELADLVGRGGMVGPKGPPGSVVFFHPEVVHGSAANMSPFPRKLLIVTYNDTANLPQPVGEPRPDYLVGRESAPLDIVDGPLLPVPDRTQV